MNESNNVLLQKAGSLEADSNLAPSHSRVSGSEERNKYINEIRHCDHMH